MLIPESSREEMSMRQILQAKDSPFRRGMYQDHPGFFFQPAHRKGRLKFLLSERQVEKKMGPFLTVIKNQCSRLRNGRRKTGLWKEQI